MSNKNLYVLTTVYPNGLEMYVDSSVHTTLEDVENHLFEMGYDNDEIEIILDGETFIDYSNETGWVKLQSYIL